MNIGLDASVLELPPTGIAKVTAGLSHACLAHDPGLTISAFHRRPLRLTFQGSITAHPLGRWVPHQYWRSLILPRAIRHADVAWFPWNGNVPHLKTTGIVASTIHDVLPLIIPGYFRAPGDEVRYRARVQQDLDRSDVVFTDSIYSRQQIVTQFRAPHEPVVIRFGPTMTPASARSAAVSPDDKPFFVYVGGYDRRKGIEGLVRLFLALHAEGKIASRLILTGTPNYFSEAFRDVVKDAVARGAVEERGYVDEPTLAHLFQRARALVYPSKYEGFGLPPLEAMTAGCPVITTRETSLPEVCGEAAVYIDPDDTRSFAEALLSIETDAHLRERLRAAGFAQAATFTWEEAAATFLGALRIALQGRRQG
ncbi:MAG: glycosyltransferase family 4 protein [Ignavibacteriae bacterium]|nr:glycosyltransferase family 4 protein [Ignavibacteriota bacterium]